MQNVTAEYPNSMGVALDFGELRVDTAGIGVLVFENLPRPRAMREAYIKQWHQEHDATPGKERAMEVVNYRSVSWDEEKPHLWNFFQAVRTRKPVVEDAVFGHHAALACHMANQSYFRKSAVTWDVETNSIKS